MEFIQWLAQILPFAGGLTAFIFIIIMAKEEGGADTGEAVFFGVIGGAVAFCITWAIVWVIDWIIRGILWFIATYWITILAIAGSVALLIMAFKFRDEIIDFIREFNDGIQTSWYDMSVRYQELRREQQFTDKAILQSSKKRARKLMALIPGQEWIDIRTQISDIATKHVPQLLSDRKQIKTAIASAQNVLQGVTTIPQEFITDFEKQQNKRTTDSVNELVHKGNQNNADITDCISVLNHVEVDLHKAMLSDTDRAALRSKLHALTSRIENNKNDIQVAQSEVVTYIEQKGNVPLAQTDTETENEETRPHQNWQRE